MRWLLWGAALAVSCGRIGFGDIADDGAVAPLSGLVAWYRFDDGSGTVVADSSGNGLKGFTNGCMSPYPTWTTGRFGGAILLTAANQNCVSASENPLFELAGNWTVSAWVSPASLPVVGEGYPIVVKPNAISQFNYALYLDHGFLGAANLGFAVAFDDSTSTRNIAGATYQVALGTWYHVAGTWDGARLTLFVDGVAVGAINPPGVPSATVYGGGDLSLLGKNQCCTQYFDGALDDVRIYSRALASSEIATLYTMP
jgi:hypothetical protein